MLVLKLGLGPIEAGASAVSNARSTDPDLRH